MADAANAQPWPSTPCDAASCGRWRRVTRSQSGRAEGVSSQAPLETRRPRVFGVILLGRRRVHRSRGVVYSL
eukprot:6172459-Pleurochrysis_carterae.AAC.4